MGVGVGLANRNKHIRCAITAEKLKCVLGNLNKVTKIEKNLRYRNLSIQGPRQYHGERPHDVFYRPRQQGNPTVKDGALNKVNNSRKTACAPDIKRSRNTSSHKNPEENNK